jgi:hypothetical protein
VKRVEEKSIGFSVRTQDTKLDKDSKETKRKALTVNIDDDSTCCFLVSIIKALVLLSLPVVLL